MDAAGGTPDVVIAPAHPDDGRREIVFEVRESAEGRNVLPVFSSVPRLVATLGPAQPWVALPLHEVRALAAGGGVHEVVLDPVARPDAWRWKYQDLEMLEQRLDRPQSPDIPRR
jgi:SseB protein N-terminal domain